MSKLKMVSLSDLRTAKDGRQYYVAGFRPGFGQKIVSRVFWQQFKRNVDGTPIEGSQYWERGSYKEAQDLLKSGELIEGEKVTSRVEQYVLPGVVAPITTYTTIVFPDENIETVFDNQNHPIVDEDGVVRTRKKKPVLHDGESMQNAAVTADEFTPN